MEFNQVSRSSRERYLSEHWRVIRMRGRARFLWRDRVLSIGLPTFGLLAVWRFIRLDLEPAAFFAVRPPVFWFAQVILAVAITYFVAALEWRTRERQFRDLWTARGLPVPPAPSE